MVSWSRDALGAQHRIAVVILRRSCYSLSSVTGTRAVTEISCWHRILIIVSILFWLVPSPAYSQTPIPSSTPLQRNPRRLNEYREHASPGEIIAAPSITPRLPRRENRANFTPAPRPQRPVNTPYLITPTTTPRYNPPGPVNQTPRPRRRDTVNPATPARPGPYATAIPITPTPPPYRYNTPSPRAPRPSRRRDDTAILSTPTQPPYGSTIATATPTSWPRRYATVSPMTPTPTPPRRRGNAPNLVTPTQPRRWNSPVSPPTATQPPRSDNTENITTPTRPPRWDITPGEPIHVRPPIPGIPAIPPIRFRSPIPYLTPTATVPFRQPIPYITPTATAPFRRPTPNATPTATIAVRPPTSETPARPGNQPTLEVSPSPPVEVGQPVLFEIVSRQKPPPGWSLQYRFDFGDGRGTEWSSERTATHTYESFGNGSYLVHVEIASTTPDRATRTKAVDKNIDVIPISNPSPAATATATPSSTSTETPSATVTPAATSTYPPTATPAPTATAFVSPTTPTPMPFSKTVWLYLTAGFLGIAALAAFAFAKSKLKTPILTRPTFHTHSDWNTPQNPPAQLAINYELHFDSNVSAAQNRIDAHGTNFIQKRSKQ